MAHIQTLWRIGDTAPQEPDLDALVAGLSNHLAHDGLASCLVQIGARQRAYVALQGCAGCAMGRCAVGCRVELLRRTLRAALGEQLTLTPVRRGLDLLGYRRILLAWPASASAGPMGGEILAGWPRARMAIRWRRGEARRRISALVSLGGADGPDVVARLRERGWACLEAPTIAHPWLANPLAPAAHWRSGALTGEPWLLLPTREQDDLPLSAEPLADGEPGAASEEAR